MTPSRDGPRAWGPRALALMVLVGLALRVLDFDVWWANPDEGLYTLIVTQPTWAAFWAEVLKTAHPPLYFVLLRLVGAVSDSFLAFRAVSLVSGCAAIVTVFLAARELEVVAGASGGTADEVAREPLEYRATAWVAGLVAAGLVAVGPHTVTMSEVVRPYMLLIALLALGLFWLLRYLRRPSTGALVGYTLSVTLATTLHYSAPFAIAAFGLLVVADGRARGWRRPAWLRLFGVHVVPAAALGTLYFVHLRGLMASSMAANAQQGWLSDFMINRPLDAWIALEGVLSMVAGGPLAGLGAALFVASIVYAVWSRAEAPAVLAVTALAVGVALAATDAYPLGATRHSSWFLAIAVPVSAWVVARFVEALRESPRRALPTALAVVALGVGPGLLPGAPAIPEEINERVVRKADLMAMGDPIDPRRGPSLVVMSSETYQTLFPLLGPSAGDVEWTADRVLFRFRWGVRDVVVVPSRDFAVLPDDVGRYNHLFTAMQRVEEKWQDLDPRSGEPVLLLAVGWRSQGMDDLAALSRASGRSLGSAVTIPGATAVYLDWSAYTDALEAAEAR